MGLYNFVFYNFGLLGLVFYGFLVLYVFQGWGNVYLYWQQQVFFDLVKVGMDLNLVVWVVYYVYYY